MDVRLMKEFEELEGLTDQHIDDDVSQLEEPEEDESFRPIIAANLNNADVYDEVPPLPPDDDLLTFMITSTLDGKAWSQEHRISRY
jgi:hypothetical protein